MSAMIGLLRAGVALKTDRMKRAAGSYARDRADQAMGMTRSYAAAFGLYAAAGLFLLTAGLVGTAALFCWVEIQYGLFWAFGASGAVLLALALACWTSAIVKLRRKPEQIPSLTSRLRVAVKAPAKPQGDHEAAPAFIAAAGPKRPAALPPALSKGVTQAGLALSAVLLGWAVARRRQQAQRGDD